uniref:SH3 domain-binding glutamic acid-rich-like protein 3 n=1 Tax=Sinocyclocheilus rhinocerous TaxID=307959 RepID=A0A673MLU1_9TELE
MIRVKGYPTKDSKFITAEVKQHQSEIFQFLDSKKIKYFAVDIAGSTDVKEEMRKKVGNPSAMPPQVFNGDKYCGDYQKFFDAVEDGKPEAFFKL